MSGVSSAGMGMPERYACAQGPDPSGVSSFDQVLSQTQVLSHAGGASAMERHVNTGPPSDEIGPAGSALANLEPAMVIQFVNSLSPAVVRALAQADLNAMVTNLARHLETPDIPDRAAARRAYFVLTSAGAMPEPEAASGTSSPDARLAGAYKALLNQRLGVSGITPNLVRFDSVTVPDWNPPIGFRDATVGPDGRGFATAAEAMRQGAGRATHEQNRPTKPFSVEAEHGYLVVRTAEDRFVNVFFRGNARLAMAAQTLIAQGATPAQRAEAIDAYRFSTQANPLAVKLLGEGKTIVALVHSHPRSLGQNDRGDGTVELPSASDLLGAVQRGQGFPGLQEAVVCKDGHGRLSMSIYEARRDGQHLDVSIATTQNVARQ